MCTVTYLPKNNGGFILTSSRDEKTIRPSALLPQEYFLHGKNIVFPKDPLGGGSWIAYSGDRTACLLNGGFKKHTPTPPYKKSRGLMLLDYFSFDSIKKFVEDYDFKGIEPFTLILIELADLWELRWDSNTIHVIPYSSDLPHVWSSVTLYSEEVISKRKTWFQRWLSSDYRNDVESIRQFHKHAGEGDQENDLVMNRDNFMRTVSITSIEKNESSLTMVYEEVAHPEKSYS
ncbi:MAG TPA: NRDE family protein [Cytophagaceae bacterium]|jgi:hypothetical protein|nr:NRDE family protein [Cytophagaceae bacterium]